MLTVLIPICDFCSKVHWKTQLEIRSLKDASSLGILADSRSDNPKQIKIIFSRNKSITIDLLFSFSSEASTNQKLKSIAHLWACHFSCPIVFGESADAGAKEVQQNELAQQKAKRNGNLAMDRKGALSLFLFQTLWKTKLILLSSP